MVRKRTKMAESHHHDLSHHHEEEEGMERMIRNRKEQDKAFKGNNGEAKTPVCTKIEMRERIFSQSATKLL